MYPRLSDFFSDVLGFDLPFPIYSFGAMVAVAVLLASWLSGKELDRLHRLGKIPAVKVAAPRNEAKKKARSSSRMIQASPSVLMGTVTAIAVVAGFAGAKVFHILENWTDFMVAPGRMLFSSGGFTFFGGLIVAGFAIAHYVRKKGVPVPRFADALAPGLMLGYGVGRIGCHLSGDGDWGIASDPAARPGFLPEFLWAETYPNNILGRDLSAAPVFPTPLYEFVVCLLLFGALWGLRNHTLRAGWLFGLYVVLAGIERFLIEQIRVNNTYDLGILQITQAEIIALGLIAVGGIILLRTWKPDPTDPRPSGADGASPGVSPPAAAARPT